MAMTFIWKLSIVAAAAVAVGIGLWWLSKKIFNGKYYYNKAVDLYNREELDKALKLLEKAFRLDPTYEPIIYNLGVIHMALENNNLSKDYFYLALQSNSEDAYALYNLGILEYGDGNFQHAIDHWLKCLEYSDDIDSDTYYCLGLAYEGLEQQATAMGVYEKTLEIDPAHVDCMVALGRLYSQAGEIDRALEIYDLALTYDTEQVEAHLGVALLQARRNRWDEVAQSLAHLEESSSDNLVYLNLSGLIHYQEGRWTDAVACFEAALKLEKGNLPLLNNLGFAFEKEGRLKKAIKCFQHVLAHPSLASENRKEIEALVYKLRHPDLPLQWPPETSMATGEAEDEQTLDAPVSEAGQALPSPTEEATPTTSSAEAAPVLVGVAAPKPAKAIKPPPSKASEPPATTDAEVEGETEVVAMNLPPKPKKPKIERLKKEG